MGWLTSSAAGVAIVIRRGDERSASFEDFWVFKRGGTATDPVPR
jgi:hypothetical protein